MNTIQENSTVKKVCENRGDTKILCMALLFFVFFASAVHAQGPREIETLPEPEAPSIFDVQTKPKPSTASTFTANDGLTIAQGVVDIIGSAVNGPRRNSNCSGQWNNGNGHWNNGGGRWNNCGYQARGYTPYPNGR
ncbi:MAG: hypothetical protein GY748_03045 [Planctomycetaceae bacterium]|nr:hypothetical protein [Planctomycetaceae bacterium]